MTRISTMLLGSTLAVFAVANPQVAVAQETQQAQLAREYLDGKLDTQSAPVTYEGDPIEIRLSSFVPKGAGLWKVWDDSFEQLKRESNGKLLVKAYPGGVLHSMQDGFKAVRSGVSDLSHCYVSYAATSFKLMHATGLPGMFPDAAVGSMVATVLYPKYFKEEYERMGVYLARTPLTPPYNIVTKKPVRTLEDLQGMKIRSVGGTQAQAVEAVGATPIFLATPEAYTAFQRGTVDGVVGHDGAFIAFRSAEPAKAWTDLRFAAVETSICMNKDFFDKLPDDLKVVFYNWLQRWNQADAQLWYEGYAAESREQMKKMGIEMIELDPAERQRILDAMDVVTERWIEEMEKEGLPARELVNEMRALSAQYEALGWDGLMKESLENPVKGLVNF